MEARTWLIPRRLLVLRNPWRLELPNTRTPFVPIVTTARKWDTGRVSAVNFWGINVVIAENSGIMRRIAGGRRRKRTKIREEGERSQQMSQISWRSILPWLLKKNFIISIPSMPVILGELMSV
jgi:hypothetical protein